MQVSKWGNSLAIRLPAAIVKALELKEGDDIEFTLAGRQNFAVKRDETRQRAFEALQKMRKPLPPGFRFSRDEANER